MQEDVTKLDFKDVPFKKRLKIAWRILIGRYVISFVKQDHSKKLIGKTVRCMYLDEVGSI